MTFWVNDCVKYCLLVAFAMYLSLVLVVGMNSLSSEHGMTKQLLCIATFLQDWNMAGILNLYISAQGLLQMSSFHMWNMVTEKLTMCCVLHSNGCTKFNWGPCFNSLITPRLLLLPSLQRAFQGNQWMNNQEKLLGHLPLLETEKVTSWETLSWTLQICSQQLVD